MDGATDGVRKASRSHAFDSPSPGEGREPERPGPRDNRWWVICGDCPTDHLTCTGDRTPRSAVEEFADRWREGAAAMMRGERLPDWSVGNAGNALELAPLLAARAELLADWGRDDEMWE
jgi:hypothetical protein